MPLPAFAARSSSSAAAANAPEYGGPATSSTSPAKYRRCDGSTSRLHLSVAARSAGNTSPCSTSSTATSRVARWVCSFAPLPIAAIAAVTVSSASKRNRTCALQISDTTCRYAAVFAAACTCL